MRFVCDSCRAQYMISDDKVGAKGVKVRCKKCGYLIVVRPAGEAAPAGALEDTKVMSTSTTPDSGASSSADAEAATLAGATGAAAEPGFFTDVEDDEIGAVF